MHAGNWDVILNSCCVCANDVCINCVIEQWQVDGWRKYFELVHVILSKLGIFFFFLIWFHRTTWLFFFFINPEEHFKQTWIQFLMMNKRSRLWHIIAQNSTKKNDLVQDLNGWFVDKMNEYLIYDLIYDYCWNWYRCLVSQKLQTLDVNILTKFSSPEHMGTGGNR